MEEPVIKAVGFVCDTAWIKPYHGILIKESGIDRYWPYPAGTQDSNGHSHAIRAMCRRAKRGTR
jgi:hypothetical protein